MKEVPEEMLNKWADDMALAVLTIEKQHKALQQIKQIAEVALLPLSEPEL